MSAQQYRAIWEPLEIGSTVVKNRIMDPAKTLLYGEDHIISDRHIAFWAERAKGGIGLVVTEQQGAHPVGKGSFHRGCTVWEKRAIPQLERAGDAVHEHGAKLFVQLYTPGVHDKGTLIMDEWKPLWGASRIPSSYHHENALVMGQEEIDSLIEGYAQSAHNVYVSGVDGVEVHGAHSYQLGQFLSPYYNTRTDRYGGSPKARCQLVIEVAEAIRKRVTQPFTVGVRLSFDEFLGENGIQPDDAAEQIEHMAATGLFDYFSISAGSYATFHLTVAGMRVPHGNLIGYAARAKEIIGDRAKVFTVGRITELALAEETVANGAADMVAMSRATLTDPFLVRKAQEGREREIVRCIGQNQCLARLFDQREVICALNPVSGREQRWGNGTLQRATDVKRVVVVGGGPSGMKVAAVAASRGHDVTLLEQEPELGGHIRLTKQLPTRAEWSVAIDSFSRMCETAGVDVRLGVEATPKLLDELRPDAVICATGSHWDDSGLSGYPPGRPSLPGVEQDNVLGLSAAIKRALEDPKALGGKVVIYDETGTYLPLGLAELLGQAGVEVQVVSPELIVGEDLLKTFEMGLVYPALRELGVELRAQLRVDAVQGDTVTITDIWTGGHEEVSGVSSVVLSTGKISETRLFDAIKDRYAEVHRLGDAVAPRKIQAVIYEAEELGRAL